MPKSKLTVWKTSLRQTFRLLSGSRSLSPSLRPLLQADGKTEDEILPLLPYDTNRAKSGAGSIPDRKRYRDARQVYRTVGLLYEKIGSDMVPRLHVTDLGRAVLRWLDTLNENNFDVLGGHLANALASCQLRNPTEEGRDYDNSVVVFPFVFIWRAMLELDWKINSEELSRAIFKVTDENSLAIAINKIMEARVSNDRETMGPPVQTVNDRIIPWMSMASFGWTLFGDKELGGEAKGYYVVPEKSRPLLRSAVAIRRKHRDYDGEADSVAKYVERISMSAALPKDIR